MIKKFIKEIVIEIENDKLFKELKRERKITEELLLRCETLANDNRKMYAIKKQYENKLREMREKNGKRNSRNKTTKLSTKA